jgi:lipopolysaccharide transport system ATP-binding protein
MSNIVISVENLSKSYRLGQIGTGTLSRDLEVWWAKVRGKPNPLLKIGQTDHGNQDGQTLWALQDVSFQVQQGEVLGIIGRNGAGKSTLLKILSRVTAPTSGQVKVKGRIASLLEVGTGFHPELTGRENIFLNGAILGMSRQEVQRKFDEIVSFAEVEKFVDTPVKRYSSGMYVRLAFAVAAHLESEILLVDEVLAVGDAEFQKKCLGKMGDVATQEGRTVLFVSHNMGSIRNLCNLSLLLVQGRLKLLDSTESVIKNYLDFEKNNQTGYWRNKGDNLQEICFDEISLVDEENSIISTIDSQKSYRIRIITNAKKMIPESQIHIRITNQEGLPVFTISNIDGNPENRGIKSGRSIYEVSIPGNFLIPGIYSALIAVLVPNIKIFDLLDNFSFTVADLGHHGTIRRDKRLGVVAPIFNWKITDGNHS